MLFSSGSHSLEVTLYKKKNNKKSRETLRASTQTHKIHTYILKRFSYVLFANEKRFTRKKDSYKNDYVVTFAVECFGIVSSKQYYFVRLAGNSSSRLYGVPSFNFASLSRVVVNQTNEQQLKKAHKWERKKKQKNCEKIMLSVNFVGKHFVWTSRMWIAQYIARALSLLSAADSMQRQILKFMS